MANEKYDEQEEQRFRAATAESVKRGDAAFREQGEQMAQASREHAEEESTAPYETGKARSVEGGVISRSTDAEIAGDNTRVRRRESRRQPQAGGVYEEPGTQGGMQEVKCGLCGWKGLALSTHIHQAHGLTAEEYEKELGLEPGGSWMVTPDLMPKFKESGHQGGVIRAEIADEAEKREHERGPHDPSVHENEDRHGPQDARTTARKDHGKAA